MKRVYLLFISTLFMTSLGNAQVISSQLLDVRNRLEKEIQFNLQNLISTQLEPTSYTVAVGVQITPITPPQKPEDPKKEGLPAGLDLGILSATEIAESYEREIEELKLKKESYEKTEEKFQLSKIEVLVGLDESYPPEYKKTFSTWLKKKMKRDYGSVADSSVSTIKVRNKVKPEEIKKPEEKPEVKPKEENPHEKYLLLYAFLAVAGALVLLGILLRGGLKQVATATKPIQLEQKSEWAIRDVNGTENAPALTEAGLNPAATHAEIYSLHEEIDKMTKKIAFVCLEINSKLTELVRVWIDGGEDGLTKTAILIDTILSAREKILTGTGSIAPLAIPLDEELAASHEESLAEAYRSVVDMELEDKITWLERVYWDLVSVKTLGLQSLRRPFDFLQSVSQTNLMEIMQTQKSDAQAMAMIYLPSETQEEVLKSLSDDRKEELIKNMLLNSQVSQKQIWDLDTSVKVSLINQSSNPTERLVNLFPRSIEVLQSLDHLDEIIILRKITPSLPEGGQILKQQYTTLAFIDDWNPEYIKKLSQVATADEIVALIRTIPTCKDLILNECAPKIKTIVEDDLLMTGQVDKSATKAKIASLKSKWTRLVLSENIPMQRVLRANPKREHLNAA